MWMWLWWFGVGQRAVEGSGGGGECGQTAGCGPRVGRAAERLEAAVVEMTRVATVVEATSQPMARRDPLRAHMDLIYREVHIVLDALSTFCHGVCQADGAWYTYHASC